MAGWAEEKDEEMIAGEKRDRYAGTTPVMKLGRG
jgi:hypothetical protein